MQIKNFNLIRTLERNTLSELYLGRHVHENYYVKVRLYDTSSITNEDVREAIIQRLRNSYQMRHRNIIATLDYGTEGRYIYQIQEHMDFGSVDDLLQKTSHVPPEVAALILQEALRGLQYAHNIGVFHGMLSPSKILLSSNGIVKIDDFQFLDLKNTFLKHVQTRIKARQQMYLAPEHLLGKEADHRCDLFSAGVIVYKMLTGKHPFLEENAEWTTMQIIACNPKLLFELDPTLPSQFEELVDKMIEKEVQTRVQNAESAMKLLDRYLDQLGEIRSYEVLANFIKKPQQSTEQLNQLRSDEFLQQATQFQMQEQWDRALVAYHRARFFKPKDKNIEQEIREICGRQGYVREEEKDNKLLQLEQSLKSNPENIQILQRLATVAKSRGDLLQCMVYYKRILKISPNDSFASNQLRQLLQPADSTQASGQAEVKWARLQNYYDERKQPIWKRWSIFHGNMQLMIGVLLIAGFIAVLQVSGFVPTIEVPIQASFSAPALQKTSTEEVVVDQKIDTLVEQAISAYDQGEVDAAIVILSKSEIKPNGVSAAKARLLLAKYLIEIDSNDRAGKVLESVDISTASLEQKLITFKLKAKVYAHQGRYGHAIDQYINIQALSGISAVEKTEAESSIHALQNEAVVPR